MFTTAALLATLTLPHPACPTPEVWLDKDKTTTERGWATRAEKAETRWRMARTWKRMGFDAEARTVLDAIVCRESFCGDTCAVHVLGENEYGLGAGGLFAKFHVPMWERGAPYWVLQIPEVTAVVMGRKLRRAKFRYKSSSTAKRGTWKRFGQLYAGRFLYEQDPWRDNGWCNRLESRGVKCDDPIGKVGTKLGSGPTDDQVVFVLELMEEEYVPRRP